MRGVHRVPPHSPVWVRLNGEWVAGWIHAGYRRPDGSATCWVHLKSPHVTTSGHWVDVWWDPRAFRRRDEYDDTPPAE